MTKKRSIGVILPLFIHQWILSLLTCKAEITVNEIAYKGSANQCNGKDWIEFFNDSTEVVNLLDYVIHDDKGKDDEDAKTFPNTTMASGEYKILCNGVDFDFGISSSDTITFLDQNGIILSVTALPGTGSDLQTYAYFGASDDYKYTMTPTPGKGNIFTEPKPLEQQLEEQNDAGKEFFLDRPGGQSDIFDEVVDIFIDMDAASLSEINDHPERENFVPFTDVTVSNSKQNSTLVTGGSGKIRTKGQSSLTIVACLQLKNIPFQIEFDTPFLGLETAYLRNSNGDASYMRDYASHIMLRNFGLPYLRTRHVRLYLNGKYIGFYTMMEAPTQGYVMQRSFGVFDPMKTALFKAKTLIDQCPFTNKDELKAAAERDDPDPYYFERGDHRDEIPAQLSLDQCVEFFIGQILKDRSDMIKGFVEYNNTCGLAMVMLGRVDRDYGPKSVEDAMINFLDSTAYNTSVSDIKDAVDSDQWIKNFAAYAVMLNVDSPINNINNWYIATTSGGANDWRIVQYDHNIIATRVGASLCSPECGVRQIYWPILRPTCGAVEDHPIVGRILNDEISRQKYLGYIQDFVDSINSRGILPELRAHGNVIKEFIIEDPLNTLSISEYEESELGSNIDEYNTLSTPFLKIIEARLKEVHAQLDAIRENTLPRDGIYGKDEVCPDWRDSSGKDYISGSTLVNSANCPIDICKEVALCYNNDPAMCSADGELINELCKPASPFCDACFPNSNCGGRNDKSNKFEECGPELAECAFDSPCFDHILGQCAFNGEILGAECGEAEQYCKPCFPNSRCGFRSSASADETSISADETSASADETSASYGHFLVPLLYITIVTATALSWQLSFQG